MNPLISIILLNYNGYSKLGGLFVANLSSIFSSYYNKYEVILVDNGSHDNSVQFVRREFPKVKVVELYENYGFAKACNIGARFSRGEILFFLNNDVIIHPQCLDKIADLYVIENDVGIVQPVILDIKVSNKSNADFQRVMQVSSSMHRDLRPQELPYAVGTALAIRRDVFLRAGKFDDKFFMYGEDVDLSFKVTMLGHKKLLQPLAIVFHEGSGTIGKERSPKFVYYSESARLTILLRYSRVSLFQTLPSVLMFHLGLILYYLAKTKVHSALSILRAYFDIFRNLSETILPSINNVDKGPIDKYVKAYVKDLFKLRQKNE